MVETEMTVRHASHAETSVAAEQAERMVLDGHKLPWHMDRVAAWERGERIAPITIDMALTRACDYSCSFCYAMLQENDRQVITQEHIAGFLLDSARMGVRGISLVSDGESLLSPAYVFTIQEGARLGISMASGTNGRVFTEDKLGAVLPSLTYIRFNVSGGTRERYCEIMGCKPESFDRVMANIRAACAIKRRDHLLATIGIQMVLMPTMADQIMPFAQLGKELGVDYAIIKHCSDDEYGHLGIQYSDYHALYPLLQEAESLSTAEYKVVVKWQKIQRENRRIYSQCFGPPFLIQISGSGLVAPCGQMFNDRYAKFHIGNICTDRWWDIWRSDRYWEVMDYLHSKNFDPRHMCGVLCLQDRVNEALFQHKTGVAPLVTATDPPPMHKNFL